VKLLRLAAAVVAAAALAAPTAASAQAWPQRSITIIAPFPPGGPSDVIGRLLQEQMQAALGQTVLIENVVGAGGNVGMTRLFRAAPDGYTVGIGQWGTHVVNAVTYKLPYDVLTDFEPIALLAVAPQVIIARKEFPAKDGRELVAWLKANPGKATAAMVGVAGGSQIAGMYFQQKTGTTFPFVSYRGGHPAMQDMVTGQVDIMFDQGPNALAQIKSGAIKAYATMAKARWFAAPEIPTVDEAGVPGLHVDYWHAMWAPKGTPKDITARLNAAVGRALDDAKVKQRFVEIGQEMFSVAQRTQAALTAYHKAEADKWWPIVRETRLKAE
jgi:tripartite-type tricarboxylate transporter receptor subunit TctC